MWCVWVSFSTETTRSVTPDEMEIQLALDRIIFECGPDRLVVESAQFAQFRSTMGWALPGRSREGSDLNDFTRGAPTHTHMNAKSARLGACCSP